MSHAGVGVIGVGAMGLGIVRALRERGFPVFVRDVIAEREAPALAAGAVRCATPAEVARRANVVITVVVNGEQTHSVLFGEDGVSSGLRPDSAVMVCSTISPADAAEFAHSMEGRGTPLLDAPISGGPARAHAGTLSMMASGSDEAFKRCGPAIAAMASHCFRIGSSPGDGSRMKLVNNMLAASNLAASAEAMAFAERLGLDLRQARDVVNASSGASWIFADRMGRALQGDFSPRAATRVLTKDVSLFVQLAHDLGLEVPMASSARRIFMDAVERGHGEEDDAALLKRYREVFGE